MTGYYRTLMRPRAHRPLSMLKYDPIGTFSLATLEAPGHDGLDATSNQCIPFRGAVS